MFKLENQMPITMKSDEKGYVDRKCPNENCEFIFKIHIEDLKNKIGENIHCPLCGYTTKSTEWNTDEQKQELAEHAREFIMSQIQGHFQKQIQKMANSTRNNNFVKFTYKPSRKITYRNNPIGQREEWNLDIACEECGTRYSVIGSAYFCPCCGHNSVDKVFDESMNCVETMLNAQDTILQSLAEQFDKDTADTMCRSMLENSIGDIVSAFQKFAMENLIKKSNLDTSALKVNDFQILSKGSNLYEIHLQREYDKFLSASEINEMNILFQKRHILEHNNGMVDEKYIKNSGDNTYTIGQRVVIKKEDALNLLNLVKKLTTELRK